MTTKVTEISKEQLAPVVTARTKAVELAQAAEQAIKDARMAELEFKVQIQQLYLEKNLDSNCKVDINTGVVTWPEVKEVTSVDSTGEVEAEAEVVEEALKRRTSRKKAAKKVS